MKKIAIFLALLAPSLALAQDLDAEKAAACEATLCLAAVGKAPGECNGALKKYFAIKIKNSLGLDPKKTLEARKNFLKLCPDVDEEIIDSVNTSGNGPFPEDPELPPEDDCGFGSKPQGKYACK